MAVNLDPDLLEHPGLSEVPVGVPRGRRGERTGLHQRRLRAGLPGARRHPRAADRRGARDQRGRDPLMSSFDDSRLDDPAALEATDHLLRRLAGAGARVRAEIDAAEEVLSKLDSDGFRPRAIVAAGRDARLVRAVLEPVCPVPFVAWPGPGLPGWAGPLDLVIVLGGTAADQEAMSAAVRGCTTGQRPDGRLPGGLADRPGLGRLAARDPSAVAVRRPVGRGCRRTAGPAPDGARPGRRRQGRRDAAGRRRDRVLAEQRRRVEPGQGPGADAGRRDAAGLGWLRPGRPRRASCRRGAPAGQWPSGARRRRRTPAAGAEPAAA